MITDFQSRSNARARTPRKICKNHLFSFWSPAYKQCIQGNQLKQPCEELMDEKEELANIKQEEEEQAWENH